VLCYLGAGGLTALAGRKWRRRRAARRSARTLLFSAAPDKAEAEDDSVSLFPDLGEVESAPSKADIELDSISSFRASKGPARVLAVEDDGLVFVKEGSGCFMNVKTGARVAFSGGARAVLIAWKETVAVMHVVSGEVTVGENVKATGEFMTTFTDNELRGRIVNPSGEPIDGGPETPRSSFRRTFVDFKGMAERDSNYRALSTGVLSVDFAVPIGRGQTMLFQGTDESKDKALLWPDLMASRPEGDKQASCICICDTLKAAEALRSNLEARGLWEQCTVVVPDSSGSGAKVLALNAAVTFAEAMNDDQEQEATVVLELEPMHRVWNGLAKIANDQRDGTVPKEDKYVEMDGTLILDSIAERRKFWFALVSRANNAKTGGSVSLLRTIHVVPAASTQASSTPDRAAWPRSACICS